MTTVDTMEFPKVELPVFPDKDFNIKDFGAVEGGNVSNTKAFNDAIKAANEAGGGRVIIPQGLWLTGPIEILSNVNVHAENGAFILFSYNPEEYPLIKTSYEGGDRIRTVSPIHAYEAENIAITGDGIFDGNGQLWRLVKRSKMTQGQWNALLKKGGVTKGEGEKQVWFPSQSSYDGHMNKDIKPDEENALERAKPYYDFYRPVMTSLIKCKKVLIEGVTLQNSPAWNLHPLFCEHFTLKDAEIRNPWYAQNGDGLDLESCKYCDIINTKFDVGDDAICMKAGKNAEGRRTPVPTEYVTIEDCTVYHGHGGFVAGSEMSRGLRKIKVKNCTFIGTDIGIRFKSTLGRGGVVEDILLENISMVNIPKFAAIFTMAYDGAIDESKIIKEDIPEFKNITLRNISCNGCGQAIQIDGLKQLPIHDITFEHVQITGRNGVKCDMAENINLKDVTIYREGDLSESVHFDNETVGDGYRSMMWA